MGVEAVLGFTAVAGTAVAADGPPVQHHPVARGDVSDVGAHGADHSGGLVAKQEREVIADAAQLVVQVGVADAAGDDVHQGLARTRIRDQDGLQSDRGALGAGYDTFDFMDHERLPQCR